MIELPIELVVYVCDYLDDKDKFSIFFACKTFRSYSSLIRLKKFYTYYKIKNFMNEFKFDNIWYFFDGEVVPHGITILCFPNMFNKSIANLIPNSTSNIIFGRNFNQPLNEFCLEETLPNLRELTFGEYFNQSIKYLPKRVIKLTFLGPFNEEIHGKIPHGTKYLTFSNSFKGCIPNSVTHLTFGNNFNQPIEGCIPNSVTHLTFGNNFTQPIEGCIPDSVTHLTFGSGFHFPIVESVNYVFKFDSYPIYGNFDDENSDNNILTPVINNLTSKSLLPSNLIHLTLSKRLYEKNEYFLDPKIKITLI
ncbi:FNIP repeat-containing protein [Moumouvirus australiensis]|uniref:FNIP repeat-containing protein n=1 Tax=Moumouvirus australiensis TaxID=2109587 RepID=A0A2P1EMT1_9VIRU|nr:FNIP repeat-containing protein [Moumouvirus australiensis]AVL95191.1 FNIP repeat-containing protein [Moumouvirus australiensis]